MVAWSLLPTKPRRKDLPIVQCTYLQAEVHVNRNFNHLTGFHTGFFPWGEGGVYRCVQRAHVCVSIPTRVLLKFLAYLELLDSAIVH